VRNLFKRSNVPKKVGSHLVSPGINQVAGAEPNQVARKRTPLFFFGCSFPVFIVAALRQPYGTSPLWHFCIQKVGISGAFTPPRPLQSLKLLAENAPLETKRNNEGDPSQSGRARRANDSGPPLPSGLRWGQHGRTSVSEWAQK
jgi:hypothetical protein